MAAPALDPIPAPNPALADALAAMDAPTRTAFRAGLLSGLLAALDALAASGTDSQSTNAADNKEVPVPAANVRGDDPFPLGDVPAATDAVGSAA